MTVKSNLKIFAVAASLVLGVATLMPAGGVTGELKSLRGDLGVTDTDQAPDIHGVKEGAGYGRAYRQQPPLIPHKIEKYEIDLKVNQCMYCHDWPNNTRMGAPKISETHYVDRQGNRLDHVARTRWFCVQCHVPQTDAPALVDNMFAPANTVR